MTLPASLLATNLLIPVRRPHLVPRPHLIERLNRGLHTRHTNLTVVCASPGYGKTTLVTEWLHNVTLPVADLDALLERSDVEPPYVLVGHSLGGMLVHLCPYDIRIKILTLVPRLFTRQMSIMAAEED